MTAYALIDDLLAVFQTQPKPAMQPRLEQLLETVTEEINDELGGYDYFRHPDSGARTLIVGGDGCDLIHFHRGIVALETVELSFDQGLTFTAIETADWQLAWDADSPDEPPDGQPWFHLRLPVTAAYRHFPRGRGTVRLGGLATGWPRIPGPLREGVVERARQIAFADPSFEGSIPSDDGYGRPVVSNRFPDVTWKFIQREKQRFMACSL